MEQLINIAIADDQLLFRECLAENLKKFPSLNVFIEASDGQELLKQINSSALMPDVVILDLSMPAMNGLETTTRLRQLSPDIKIIILSAHAEDVYVARLVQHGINGFLPKNSSLNEVYKAICTITDTGFYFNETVKRALQSGEMNKRKKIKELDGASLFTNREKEILELICQEFTTHEIADKLFLSIRTIDGHRNNLLEKTGARNTAGLVVYALRNHLVQVDI